MFGFGRSTTWHDINYRNGTSARKVDEDDLEAVIDGLRYTTKGAVAIAGLEMSTSTGGKVLYRTAAGRFFMRVSVYIVPIDATTARDLFAYPYAKQLVSEVEAFGSEAPLA